jgi:hypothetical protein
MHAFFAMRMYTSMMHVFSESEQGAMLQAAWAAMRDLDVVDGWRHVSHHLRKFHQTQSFCVLRQQPATVEFNHLLLRYNIMHMPCNKCRDVRPQETWTVRMHVMTAGHV